jgi:RNA polymerase sigma factor (sigma-70 family)
MIPLSLTPLVTAAAHGDERAWHELVDRFTPTLRRAVGAYRLTGPEAEDVMQTTWLALVESIHTLRDAEALPGWLATTARRQSLRARNSGGREVPLADLPEEQVPDSAQSAAVAAERADALRAALRRLPARQRALLELLVDKAEPSYVEAARHLGLPRGSIGPTRARALARLRADGRLTRAAA